MTPAGVAALVLLAALATEGALTPASATPSVAIEAPAPGAVAVAGETVALVGSASDPLDGDIGAALSWESDRQGALGSGPSVVAVGLVAGTHTITARVTNSLGLSAAASVSLRILSASLAFAATADAYVAADAPASNFGTAPTLQADASPDRQGLLRFLVTGTAGLVIERATLRLTVSTRSGSGSNHGGVVHPVGDTGWGETTVTYATRPSITGPALASQGAVAQRDLVDFDVTAAVAGDGPVAFALATPSKDAVKYKTRETASGQPMLVLNVRSASVPDAAPAVAITAPADGTHVTPGTVVTLAAIASDREEGDLAGAVEWSANVGSSNAIADLGTGSPRAVILPAGAHRVRAAVADGLGQAAFDEITITVGTAPVVTIQSPIGGSAAVAGEAVALLATATDGLDGNLNAALGWYSDLQGFVASGPSVVTLGLVAGTHTLTARVTNSLGIVGQASVIVRVVPASLVLVAAADAHVAGDAPTLNFGTAPTLEADASPDRQGFLRFVVAGTAGLVIEQATLQLTVSTRSGSDSDHGGVLYAIGDTGWAETTLTYASRPALDGEPLAILGPVSQGALVELDVTAAIGGDGPAVFALASPSGNAVKYKTRETADGRPTLVLRLRSASVPDAPPAIVVGTPADGTQVMPGTAVTLAAMASDREEGDLSAAIEWSSDLVGPLGTGSPLAVTLPVGRHVVEARVADGLGQLGLAETSVIVDTPPVVTISSPTAGTIVAHGAALHLGASAADAEEGDLSASLVWSADHDGTLGAGPSLDVDSLTPGTHTLTASVTDGLGATGSASVTVVVRAATLSLSPIADAYVAADLPAANFGTAKTLTADASPERMLLMRFAITGLGHLPPDRAKLRLTVSSASGSASDSGGAIRGLTDTGWDEHAVTYTDRPAVDGPELDMAGPVESGQVVEFDVTDAITGDGTYAFALVTGSENGVGYLSRESGSGAPQLLLVTAGLSSDPPMISIGSPAEGTTVELGSLLTLSAVATDPEEGDLSPLIEWSSNRDGVLGQGADLTVGALSLGDHVVTATVTDASGGMATGSVSITVTGGILVLPAVADATVDADAPDKNFGASSELAGDASPVRRFYLRFAVPDLAGRRITQATVRLAVRAQLDSGSDSGGEIHGLGTAAWTEPALTFNTSPPVTGPILGSAGPVIEGQVVDFDVTGAVADGAANDFVIDTASSDKVRYKARESGADGPQLILVVE